MELKELENEIAKIKERNKKVELDKAWETSWTRKICIMNWILEECKMEKRNNQII